MTTTPLPKPLLAAAGVLSHLLHRALAWGLPWASRSQHTAYLNGYADGLAEKVRRG